MYKSEFYDQNSLLCTKKERLKKIPISNDLSRHVYFWKSIKKLTCKQKKIIIIICIQIFLYLDLKNLKFNL